MCPYFNALIVTPQSGNQVSTPSATVVSAEPFSHGTGTLRCLQKMATYRHWSVSLWRDPDDVSHCRILSPDKTEWWLISATLCGWRCCFVADQLWLMSRIREEEEEEEECVYEDNFRFYTHARWSEMFWQCLVNVVQNLSKSVNSCKRCCKFTVTSYGLECTCLSAADCMKETGCKHRKSPASSDLTQTTTSYYKCNSVQNA